MSTKEDSPRLRRHVVLTWFLKGFYFGFVFFHKNDLKQMRYPKMSVNWN